MVAQTTAKRIVLALCIAFFCIAMGLREEVNVWIGTGLAALASVILLWVSGRPSGWSMFSQPTIASLLLGVGVGVAMSFATWWLYPLSIRLVPGVEGEVQMLYGLLRQPPGPVRALPLLLFVLTAEELVWRGLAINVFGGALGPWRAVLVSALLYILPQIAFRSPLLIVVALLCGIVWGALRVRTKGLVAPLAAHAVWDVLVFILYPVA